MVCALSSLCVCINSLPPDPDTIFLFGHRSLLKPLKSLFFRFVKGPHEYKSPQRTRSHFSIPSLFRQTTMFFKKSTSTAPSGQDNSTFPVDSSADSPPDEPSIQQDNNAGVSGGTTPASPRAVRKRRSTDDLRKEFRHSGAEMPSKDQS